MMQRSQLLFGVLLAVFCADLYTSEAKSLGSLLKRHNIKKRSLYEETCPPPYVMEVTEQCNDSCLDDDYCVGNQMCCFDGCSYVCMDPVPAEAIIDWLDAKDAQEVIGEGELEVVTPVIEELGCLYHEMMLNDGETIVLGCRRCSCFNGNMMCDVSNCNKEYQSRRVVETSASGSDAGEDDEDGRMENDSTEEASGDKWYPIHGAKQKESFIPFKEDKVEKNQGVETKETFIPFRDGEGEDEDGASGEESGDDWLPVHGLKHREDFIPFKGDGDEEYKGVGTKETFIPFRDRDSEDENGDEDRASGEESGDDWFPVHGLKRKEDFIPFEVDKFEENKGVGKKETFIPFRDRDSEDENGDEDRASGEESGDDWFPVHGLKRKEDFIPFEVDKFEENKGVGKKETFIPFRDRDSEDENGDEDRASGEESGDDWLPVHGLKPEKDLILSKKGEKDSNHKDVGKKEVFIPFRDGKVDEWSEDGVDKHDNSIDMEAFAKRRL